MFGRRGEELNRRRWQEGHPLVDTKEVAAVLPKAAERAENYFLEVWNSQVPSPAKLLVRQLAHQGKVPAVDPADDNLVEALLALERHHILARGPNGCRLVQFHLDSAWAHFQLKEDPLAVIHLLDAERVAPQLVHSYHTARDLIQDLLAREHRGQVPGLRGLALRAGVLA